ncbi:MAG: hypothetical protein KAT65_19175 [Methanophagales archaeon]|nr:hypothetical protein [Methanophagales archaeon]
MNKVENLLKTCEEKINKPWYNWINWEFLWYGFWDELEKIREKVFEGVEDLAKGLDEDEVKAFIDICNSRIDRIKTLSRDLVTVISASAASLGVLLVLIERRIIKANGDFPIPKSFPVQLGSINQSFPTLQWVLFGDGDWGFRIILSVLFIVIVLLAPLIGRYRAQTHAWYAIKEGTLLMYAYAKRGRKRKARHR